MTERLMVFIPVYNCERQIGRVLAQFTPKTQGYFAEIVVIDNCSQDGTREAATKALQNITGCKTTLLQNNQNYGLGGSHKVAFLYALVHGYDYCLVLHGDDQADLQDILPELDRGTHRHYDCLLNARFMPGATRQGYSWFRTAGNVFFNLLFSLVTRRIQWDLGSGLCCYSRNFLQKEIYKQCSNDLTFSYTLQLLCAAQGISQKFFPSHWRTEDQISNVKMFHQAWQMIVLLGEYIFRPSRFIKPRHDESKIDYSFSVVESKANT